MNQPTKIAINIPPRGSKIWFAIKSIESRKFLPGVKLKSESKLKLSAVPIPKVHAKKEIASAERFLDKKPSSDKYATVSYTHLTLQTICSV